jgi:UDP-glucose:(heptosyl)LPS alpha-1,3-glucosyltransferase
MKFDNKNTVVILKRHLDKIGGLEKYSWKIASSLVKKNKKVLFLTTQAKKDLGSKENISFKFFKNSGLFSFSKTSNFDKSCTNFLKENKFPIALGMDRNRFQTHIRAGNGVHLSYLKRRSIFDNRFKNISFKLNPLHKTFLDIEKDAFQNPFLKKIIANSHMVKDEIIHSYNVDPKQIIVIHNGVEWVELENHYQNFDNDKNVFQFLFIGNGFQRKGLKEILFALSQIKDDFHLKIVGRDKKANKFKRLANKLNLEKKVTFLDEKKDILSLYQESDVLLIPSFYDPFANVTIEALAMGLFVISSKYNGAKEILSSNTGLVIEDQTNIDCVISALKTSLKHKKTTISAKKIRDSVKHLDFSKQLNKLINEIV